MSHYAEYAHGSMSEEEFRHACEEEARRDKIAEAKFEQERLCSTCIHHKEGGCSAWECEYEEKEPLTLEKALKIAECMEIDYGNMKEEEIEELDEAIDKIWSTARSFLTEKTAEMKPYQDKFKCGWCANIVTRYNKYCSSCGRRLLRKGETI